MSIANLKKMLADVCLDVVNDQIHGSDSYQDNIARLGAVLLAFGARFPEEFHEPDMADIANRQLEKLADNGILSEDDVSFLRYDNEESPEDATRGEDKEVKDNDVEVKDDPTASIDNGQRRSAT